jgi:hypothetical protein
MPATKPCTRAASVILRPESRAVALPALRSLWLVLFSLALSWPALTLSAQLTPVLEKHRIGVLLEKVRLPQRFREDLRSGLTSRILIQITLLEAEKPVLNKLVDIAVKYDLWDETFGVTVAIDNVSGEPQVLAREDDVIAMLSRLNIPGLFSTDPLQGSKELTLAARVLFNPLERERLEEIRRWVAENSRPASVDPATSGSLAAPPVMTDSRSLFNKIFEQYAAGAVVAAAFADSAASKPFELKDLHDEQTR